MEITCALSSMKTIAKRGQVRVDSTNRRRPQMWSWIIIAVLYLIGAGFFYLLGGLGSASDALQQWGRTTGSSRSRHSPMS
jgi:hypothetical protein